MLISLACSIVKRYRSEFIFGLQIVCKQVFKLAQNRNAENLSFARNKRLNNGLSDNWSITPNANLPSENTTAFLKASFAK